MVIVEGLYILLCMIWKKAWHAETESNAVEDWMRGRVTVVSCTYLVEGLIHGSWNREEATIMRVLGRTQTVILLYHFDQMFMDLEIFGQKKYKKKSEKLKEKHFE